MYTISQDQIAAMCLRGLSTNPAVGSIEIDSVEELDGGTFNSIYLVTFADQRKVVLRIAPQETDDPFRHSAMMRHEYQMHPYFAGIAHLMPTILMADFTHQIVAHDYMFQHYIAGQRWDDIEDRLLPEKSDPLWQQFGEILRKVHDTPGEKFGWTDAGQQYGTWSALIYDQFERILRDLKQAEIDSADFEAVYTSTQANQKLLDEVQKPSLLHGDLWTFNILIERGVDGPYINGILDVEFAWWGDPLADFTFFIWEKGDGAEMEHAKAAFWEGYGEVDGANLEFRAAVCNAMHLGRLLLLQHREQSSHGIERVMGDLREIRRTI